MPSGNWQMLAAAESANQKAIPCHRDAPVLDHEPAGCTDVGASPHSPLPRPDRRVTRSPQKDIMTCGYGGWARTGAPFIPRVGQTLRSRRLQWGDASTAVDPVDSW